ncbi:PE-PGRS family protein [Mycobacterium tuberculosis RGTB327]|nr:PE-PGRS family protein [Mycobacterium tuberculosis RGTB327]
MSFVVVAPEVLAAAASDLAGIGSTLAQANAAALAPTTAVLAAGADEVSAAIASLFGAHGQAYQAVSAQMSAFHAQFMQALTGAGGAYAAAEAVNVFGGAERGTRPVGRDQRSLRADFWAPADR